MSHEATWMIFLAGFYCPAVPVAVVIFGVIMKVPLTFVVELVWWC